MPHTPAYKTYYIKKIEREKEREINIPGLVNHAYQKRKREGESRGRGERKRKKTEEEEE